MPELSFRVVDKFEMTDREDNSFTYSILKITSITIVLVPVFFITINYISYLILSSYPELTQSHADRINKETIDEREKLVPTETIQEWYDLESAEEIGAMWEEFYSTGAEFESYTHFKSKSLLGNYYGVTEHGFRQVKDQVAWPPSDENYNIFFFGGSTSFGVGPYWATIASYLQEELREHLNNPRIAMYNFGRSGYQSSQETVLFGRLLATGVNPNLVVFFDGLNDFCFVDGNPSSWQSLARYFNDTNQEYLDRVAGRVISTDYEKLFEFVSTMPSIRLTNGLIERMTSPAIPAYDRASQERKVDDTPAPDQAILMNVIERYQSNKAQVRGIAAEMGIQTLFAWQPIPHYKYDPQYHVYYPESLGCHIHSKFGYPLMRELTTSRGPARDFLWLADIQETSTEALYVDAFHYTAPMSKRIAEYISQHLIENAYFD